MNASYAAPPAAGNAVIPVMKLHIDSALNGARRAFDCMVSRSTVSASDGATRY